MDIRKINLCDKFGMVKDFWSPCVVGELNGQLVTLARYKGIGNWRMHQHEDESFYVVKGVLTMLFLDRQVDLQFGEMLIVPAGVEHCPFAEEDAWVMVFEPGMALDKSDRTYSFIKKDLRKI